MRGGIFTRRAFRRLRPWRIGPTRKNRTIAGRRFAEPRDHEYVRFYEIIFIYYTGHTCRQDGGWVQADGWLGLSRAGRIYRVPNPLEILAFKILRARPRILHNAFRK